MKCALISCSRDITPDTGRVDVRAFQIHEGERKKLQANWSPDGAASFHKDCWAGLKLRARNVGEGKPLDELEVKLVEEANKTAEVHDPDSHIAAEARRIADMLRRAKYPIAFTGAGISTAAGIGDFRGIHGKWTNQDKAKEHGQRGSKGASGNRKSLIELRPTYTHEAIVKLLEMGTLKYLISQNTDGLHRLSGVPEESISELHGNAFVQKCEKCHKRYLYNKGHRQYAYQKQSVPEKKCDKCRINHRTGLVCEDKKCGGYLMNTIINFGDFLEGPVLGSAEDNAKKADIVLCLGSTLMVSPANSLVEMGHQPIRLVICNRQKTPYDNYCTQVDENGKPVGCRIYGDCDTLMRAVMREMLGSDALKEWEGKREQRLAEYDNCRQ